MKFSFKKRKKKSRKKGSSLINNMSIGKKLGVSLGIVFLLFILSAANVIQLINNIGEDVSTLESRSERALEISEVNTLTQTMGLRIANYVHYSTASFVTEYNDRLQQYNVLIEKLEPEMDTVEKSDLLNQVILNNQTIDETFTQAIIPAVESGDFVTAKRTAQEVNGLQLETVVILDILRDIVNDESQGAVNQVKEGQELTSITLTASIIISILIGSTLVFYISRNISRNLKNVVKVSNKIADGDLTVNTLTYQGKDEIGRISLAMNKMSANLREMIQNISNVSEVVNNQSEKLTDSANEVKLGSEQVASTMQELAVGADTQANHLSNFSVAMGTFTEKISEANENGGLIQTSSDSVLNMTKDGTDLMHLSMSQMEKIDQIVRGAVNKVQGLDTKSQEITKLVHVIKNISDQTNLLALNAAIEAARAGEHGRGFAVVADEVRKLAEQVGVSVKDITTIVHDIQSESSNVAESLQIGYKEVKEGTNQINATGETIILIDKSINQMVETIEKVTENLIYINSKSHDMNGSLQEVAAISEESAASVEEASATTEQTSASMEEVASNSNELNKLATKLDKIVSEFRL
ncbi:methyl-accepting chemotaxis protein [Paraliobacillus sediminis]|uniref:methyl-accepting chemotaxis protein n=1 Tax=Paraliobacillus sediminis TaxID=1885916 RepID=UPI000E3EBC38|nr:methyl-accepting chemotaxis protein [Paraliobacillus sediminis]